MLKFRQDYIYGVPSTMSGTSYNLCEIKSMYYFCKDISCRGTTIVNDPVDLKSPIIIIFYYDQAYVIDEGVELFSQVRWMIYRSNTRINLS